MQGYRISDDRSEMDLPRIHGFIASSYWGKGVPFEVMQRAVENSLCFGVFSDQGEQVGFARMITDYATFAYLADVFIDVPHRGQGLSKWLMQEIHAHTALQGLRRTLLATKDAHNLYEKFGYTSLNDSGLYMEKWNPDVYKASK